MKRSIFCLFEKKIINSMDNVEKGQVIYPAEFLLNQKPIEEKYRFNLMQYNQHKCPNCNSNCMEFFEENL